MDNNRFSVEIPIPIHIYRDRGEAHADGYIAHALRQAKREMIEALFEKAWHGRYWVIRLDEEWPSKDEVWYAEHGMRYSSTVSYRLTMRITEAQSREYVPPVEYSIPVTWRPMPVTDSFIGLVKHKIRKWRKKR